MPGAALATRVRATLPLSVVSTYRAAQRRLPVAPTSFARCRGRQGLSRIHLVEPLGPDAAECPICGLQARVLLPYGRGGDDRRCPRCGSLERHRMLWLYFQRETSLFDAPLSMLHIAPERAFEPRLRRVPALDYLTGDLDPTLAMEAMDVTAIPRPDASFDVVYASHVLEHVADDRRAMAELCRVLRPGGWAIIQVPIWGPTTREDRTVTEPEERARLYGQPDHHRMYGHDGEFERRLVEAGFSVEVIDYVASLPADLVTRHRLRRAEDIYLCRRP